MATYSQLRMQAEAIAVRSADPNMQQLARIVQSLCDLSANAEATARSAFDEARRAKREAHQRPPPPQV